MTCKDCKQWDECRSIHKSDKPESDGDTWANWCEDFDTIHKTKEIERDGYKIIQSGINWHIMIFKKRTGGMVFHASCTKEMTEEQLSKELDLYFALIAGLETEGYKV